MNQEMMAAGQALSKERPKKGKKKPTMRIIPASSGGYAVHHEPDADDMERMSDPQLHVMADTEALHQHIHKHYGSK